MSSLVIENRLKQIGIILPEPPQAVGNYVPVNIANGIGFVSGQFPLVNGKLYAQGIIGDDMDVETAKKSTEIAALNVLAQIRKATNNWETFLQLARVDGYFVTGINFISHPQILDSASDLFSKILDKQGIHARSVFGVSSLPLNSPVELVVQFYVK
jgi:enamine deaminase RidA (YjgF/YER057c/UK114 family)